MIISTIDNEQRKSKSIKEGRIHQVNKSDDPIYPMKIILAGRLVEMAVTYENLFSPQVEYRRDGS